MVVIGFCKSECFFESKLYLKIKARLGFGKVVRDIEKLELKRNLNKKGLKRYIEMLESQIADTTFTLRRCRGNMKGFQSRLPKKYSRYYGDINQYDNYTNVNQYNNDIILYENSRAMLVELDMRLDEAKSKLEDMGM